MSRPAAAAGIALALAVLGVGVPARANEPSPRRLFREGIALRDAGDLDGAIERFESAHRRAPHDDRTTYNFAELLARRGRLVESRELLRTLVAPDADLLVADAARELLRDIGPRIAVVTVAIDALAPSQRLYVDGRSRGGMRAGLHRIPIDPGNHRIEIRDASGSVLVHSDVELAAYERRRVDLEAHTPSPAPAAALRVGPHRPARDRGVNDSDLWLALGIGAGSVVLTAGVVIAVTLGMPRGDDVRGDFDPIAVGRP